jgi:DnaK suppressor protein
LRQINAGPPRRSENERMSVQVLTLTQHLGRLLRQRQSELRDFLHAAAGAAVGASDEPYEVLDFKDMAAEDRQALVDEVATEHAARELGELGAALRRLDEGSYGFCLDCGDPIDERRLLALPATRYCTSCQAIHERPRPARK